MKKAETIIAACALLVSVTSVWFTITEAKRAEASRALEATRTQKARELSVQPHVTIGKGWDVETHFYRVAIMNNGLGPARIKWVKHFYGKQEISNWTELFVLMGLTESPKFTFTNQFHDSLIPVNHEKPKRLLTLQEKAASQMLAENMQHFTIVCYCSLYGDCKIETAIRDFRTALPETGWDIPSCKADQSYPQYFDHRY
ncbi:MAG: hypothetical protein GJ676_09655 [Rhodobacteraceae bacterium]|nr:hypothetical protein [Paracoccaceae bacterium]